MLSSERWFLSGCYPKAGTHRVTGGGTVDDRISTASDAIRGRLMDGGRRREAYVRLWRGGFISGNDRMLVDFAVTGCCWPLVISLARSVTEASRNPSGRPRSFTL